MADKLLDLALQQQVYLERLKAGQSASLRSVQASLRARTRQILDALDVDTLDQLTRRKLNDLVDQLRTAYDETIVAEMFRSLDDMKAIAGFVAGNEAAGLMKLTETVFKSPTMDQAYLAALREPLNVQGVEGMLLEDFTTGWTEIDRNTFSAAVRLGHQQGLTVNEMKKRVLGTKGLNWADGLADKTERTANAILHTATQHVANAARNATYEANSDLVKGYEIVATLDRRITQRCRSLDGQRFELGKGPMPPFHVRCRTTTRPDLGPAFAFLREGATRASSGPNPGQVDASKDYYDWLKTQPQDFQDKALGPVRGKLFRDGGLSADQFSSLNLSKQFEPLTLKEMKALNPEAFELAGITGYN